jgi:membrane protease YdiL (CAAX protease family)
MSWNDRLIPRALNGCKRIFLARDHALRAAWRLILALVLYYLWTGGVAVALTHAADTLFRAWGITANNVHLAPGYARWLAGNYAHLITIISACGVAYFAYRAAPDRAQLKLRPARFALGTLIGAAVVLAGGALMLAFDSMRMPSSSPAFSPSILIYLPVLLAAALAEEMFARGFALRMVKRRANRAWAYAASTVVFLFVTGAYQLTVMGMVNMLLFSAALCALSERWSIWATAGLRFGWSFAITCVMAFPGGGAARPILALYPVSETLLTGGYGGLIAGLYMTVLLLIPIALLIGKPNFRSRRANMR